MLQHRTDDENTIHSKIKNENQLSQVIKHCKFFKQNVIISNMD